MAKPKPLLGILAGLRSEVSVFYWFFYRSLVEQFSFRSWFVMRILGMIVGITTYSIFPYVVPSADINAQIAARYGFTGRNPFLDFFLIGTLVQNMITLGGTGISRLVNPLLSILSLLPHETCHGALRKQLRRAGRHQSPSVALNGEANA